MLQRARILQARGHPARRPSDDIHVAMQLAPEEPQAGPWHAELLTVIIEALTPLGACKAVDDRSAVLAVERISLLPVLHRSPSIQSPNSLLPSHGRDRDGHSGDTHNRHQRAWTLP